MPRRYFRARQKISYPGAVSHITQRAPGREALFIEDDDCLALIAMMKRAASDYGVTFLSFALMPNHLHFLIRLQRDNLSAAMKFIFEKYAKRFNRKYGRKGHVFCGRFRQALCLDNSYLLASSVYIHVNPVAAGIVKHAEDYRWSSVRPFLETTRRTALVDYQTILSLLDSSIDKARNSYRTLIDLSIRSRTVTWRPQPTTLEAFRHKLVAQLKRIGLGSTAAGLDSNLDRDVEALACQKGSRNPVTIAARKHLIQQLLSDGYIMSEISARLNLTRQAVYHILRK
jgi:putative transposase